MAVVRLFCASLAIWDFVARAIYILKALNCYFACSEVCWVTLIVSVVLSGKL